MKWDFETFLTEQLNIINNEKGYGLNFEISNEQAFAKLKSFDPNTIYIIIKYLGSSIEYDIETQPIQIMCIAEQNSLDLSRDILDTYAKKFNWSVKLDLETGFYLKQEYSSPVVLSNFNSVGYGYRSVIYLTATFYMMENVIDLEELEIDEGHYKPLSFSLTYQMAGNTQPVGDEYLSKTVKNSSTLSISMTVQMLNNDFVNKVLQIANGDLSGNTEFDFSFYIGDNLFSAGLKLISLAFATAPNNVPTIQLGFMR